MKHACWLVSLVLGFAIHSFCCPPLACSAATNPAITRGDATHTTELWEGRVLTARFRAGMCFGVDGKARGVLVLRHSNGNEDVYHLYGQLEGDKFSLSHGSGHFFSGELTSPDRMKGSVKLNNGMRLSLSGSRQRGAPLLSEDCAPLPNNTQDK